MTQAFSIQGHAYLAGSSRRMAARIDAAPHEGSVWVRVVAEDGQELARAPLANANIGTALGSTARKLLFDDGTLFETQDHAGFAALDTGTRGAQLHALERFGPHLIAFTTACLAAAYLLWKYGLDILAALAVAATPQVVIEKIDIGTLQTLDFVIAEKSTLTKEEEARARSIYARVLAALPKNERNARDFKLLFRAMPEAGPNAFALPGGTMVMTDELIREFPNEDVIAGILGHEIGHVVEEHGLRRLYRSLGSYVLIALLAGETGPMLEDILLEGNALMSLSYSRAQESAADEFGLTLSHRAGFDPAGLKVFFERLGMEIGDDVQWMSTHPSHSNRVEAIERYINGLE
jgi:Zn-dependent protease with chaperone function